MDEDLKQKVEEPLEYGETRSERIRKLINMGLAAEAEMQRHGMYPESDQERRHVIMQAIEMWAEEQ